MINNYCKKCNVEIETSECSICGERAEVKSQLYWCEKCNVPLYDEKCCICGTVGKKSTTDIRPVFPEERLLLEILIGEPFKYLKSSVWNGAGNRYIVDGKSIKVSISDLMKMDSKVVISKLNELKEQNTYEYFNEYIEKFQKANKAIVGKKAFFTFSANALPYPSNKNPINRFNVWSKKLNEKGNKI